MMGRRETFAGRTMKHPMTYAIAAVALFAFLSGNVAAADPKFEGRKKCSSCHKSQAKSWKKTAHAKAMNSLKPNKKVKAKKRAKIDPTKDYTKVGSIFALFLSRPINREYFFLKGEL